jgi:hypothetical protein
VKLAKKIYDCLKTRFNRGVSVILMILMGMGAVSFCVDIGILVAFIIYKIYIFVFGASS